MIYSQEDWWYGESVTGSKGWFPKSYVKVTTTAATTVPTSTNGHDVANPVAAVTPATEDYYVALYQYASNEPDDLSFNDGEIINVLKKDGQWWTGTIGNRSGFFPSNYVEKCDAPLNQVINLQQKFHNSHFRRMYRKVVHFKRFF